MSLRGIVRGCDKQNRIIVPIDMLRGVGIEPDQTVEIWGGQDPDGRPCLYVRKYEPGCWICGGSLETGTEVGGKHICVSCTTQIQKGTQT